MTPGHADAVVREHLAAFNNHDTARLIAGFADDAVWMTGPDVVVGVQGLRDLFDDALWGLAPSLTVTTFVSDEHHVAAELTEQLTVDGERRTMSIAAFFTVVDGRITRAKVYREGSADVE